MTPAETMAMIVSLRQAGKMEEAASHFAEGGLLVLQPGQHAVGRAEVLQGLIALSKIFPSFEISSRTVVEANGIALHHSRWSGEGTGPDGTKVTGGGVTADVLVRQADGGWLVMIDNPWGGTLLG